MQAVAQRELLSDIEYAAAQFASEAEWKARAKELKLSLDCTMPGQYTIYHKSRKLGTVVEKSTDAFDCWWENRRQITLLRLDDGDRKRYETPYEAAIALAELCKVIDEGDRAKTDLFGGGWDKSVQPASVIPQVQLDPFGGFAF